MRSSARSQGTGERGALRSVFAETQTRVDYAGVVVYQHRVGRKQGGKLAESVLRDFAIVVAHQQFTGVAHLQGVFGYALVG